MTIEQQIYNVDEGLQSQMTGRRYRISFKGFLDYCQLSQEALLQESSRQKTA